MKAYGSIYNEDVQPFIASYQLFAVDFSFGYVKKCTMILYTVRFVCLHGTEKYKQLRFAVAFSDEENEKKKNEKKNTISTFVKCI